MGNRQEREKRTIVFWLTDQNLAREVKSNPMPMLFSIFQVEIEKNRCSFESGCYASKHLDT